MRPFGQTTLGTLLSSGGLVMVLVASVSGYVRVTNDVFQRTTPDQVEHIVDLKTRDRLEEINRRLAHIEDQLDRAAALLASRQAHGRPDPEDWPKPRGDVAGQH